MRIIPAIDIIDGKCVRLSQGQYDQKTVYHEDPVELAKTFEGAGIRYLHVVDLDGAKARTIQNHKILASIVEATQLQVDFGGGIQTKNDLQVAFESGAHQVTLGSLAVQKPDLFMECLEDYGPDKIILGADCRNRKIATHGWLKESEKDVLEFIEEYSQKGVQYTVCTDIARDGMLEGPALKLYETILENADIHLIASGGVRDGRDLIRLRTAGCEGAIVGKAIYEGNIKLKELSELC